PRRVGVARPLKLFQAPGTPRLELVADDLGTSLGGDDDMHVVGAAADDMQVPAANGAMFGDRRFDEVALLAVEGARLFLQERAGGGLESWVGWPELSRLLDPAARIARQPGTLGGPRQEVCERLRHRDVAGVGTHGGLRGFGASEVGAVNIAEAPVVRT